MPFSEKEQQQINTLVAGFEADTGIQVVAAVIGKADAYPEIPWKAYALGSALGACAVVFFPFLLADWSSTTTVAFHAMAILGAGAVFAVAAALIPPVGRVFLERLRAEGETRQYALTLFLEREVFRTTSRCALLILVSRFERTVAIVADTGLARFAPAAERERIATAMRPAVATGALPQAFEKGLGALRALLQAGGFSTIACDTNEIDDAVVMEKGA